MILRLCVLGALLACVFAGAAQATNVSQIRALLHTDYTAGTTKNGALLCSVRSPAARKRLLSGYATYGKKTKSCAVAANYILRHNVPLSKAQLAKIRRAIATEHIKVVGATASTFSEMGIARFVKLNGRWTIDYISYIA